MFLGDFVEQLAANLQSKSIAMPFESEGPWHELFFDLKRTDQEGKPSFLESLRFDWDGPYPKCQELSEFFHALHWMPAWTLGNRISIRSACRTLRGSEFSFLQIYGTFAYIPHYYGTLLVIPCY